MDIKKQTEKLLLELKNAGYDRRRIERELNRRENYIDQTLSKGSNEKFVFNLEKLLQKAMMEEYNIGDAIKKIDAKSSVMLSAIAELLSKSNGRMVTTIQEELESLVNARLNSSEQEQ